MATITPYNTKAGRRWRVRYRKPNRTQTDKRGFRTKRDAQLFAATVETRIAEGSYVDPTAGRVTIGQLGDVWLTRQTHLKPSTYTVLRGAWTTHVKPEWGDVSVNAVNRTDVSTWVSQLTGKKSATVVLRALGVLKGILDGAVDDGMIAKNPAVGLTNLPRKKRREHIYLTHKQVSDLSNAAGEYGTVVMVACYLGLRWGEITGLRVKDFNPLRKRITVAQNVVRVGSTFHVGTPKSHELRTVAIPAFLVDELSTQAKGKSPDDSLFPGDNQGYLMRPKKNIGWWKTAKDKARVPASMTPHDMRHTAASLAVQSGAHVKAVQKMLGHASAAMTLDQYSGLFDTDLDEVAASLDAARTKALA